eukprot:s2863_g4.t1
MRSSRPRSPRSRLYKHWRGKSKFYCAGRCITGGEGECPIACLGGLSCASLATWICILVPSALYFAFVLPRLQRQNATPLLVPTSLALFVATVFFLLATCCSDPGIIPPRKFVLATGNRAQLAELLGYDLLGPTGHEPCGDPYMDAANMVPEALRAEGYRWCHTNYHFFIGFTTVAIFLAIIVLPAILWTFSGEGENGENKEAHGSFGWYRVVVMLGCGAVAVAALMLVLLWIYHLWLVFNGKTTKEHWRQLDLDSEPTLLAPRGPRLLRPFDLVDEDALA